MTRKPPVVALLAAVALSSAAVAYADGVPNLSAATNQTTTHKPAPAHMAPKPTKAMPPQDNTGDSFVLKALGAGGPAVPAQHQAPPYALSKSEKDALDTQSRLEMETRLWKARAAEQAAYLSYVKASHKLLNVNRVPHQAHASDSNADLAQPLHAPAPPPPQPAPEMIYGSPHHLKAQVSYRGAQFNVQKGSSIGDWKVAKVESSAVVFYHHGHRKVITLTSSGQ